MHIDIKRLPQMPDEEQKRYLYVAIDRATRWVYLEVRRSQSAKVFMKRVEGKAPFTTKRCSLTTVSRSPIASREQDERKPSSRHPFDQECQTYGIKQCLVKPGRPRTNGMVERFNGRISDVLATRRYVLLKRYYWLYNHHIP